MAQRSTEKRRFKEVFRRAPQETVSLVRVQLGEPKQKPITIVVGFCFVFLFLHYFVLSINFFIRI